MLSFSLPRFRSVDRALQEVAATCIEEGARVQPRSMGTVELPCAGFALTRPRARMTSFVGRKWSLPLAIGEFLWHLRGSDDLHSLEYYAPSWRKYSDDGEKVRGSCYGKKAFGSTEHGGQWAIAEELLRKEPDTRRAIITFDQMEIADGSTVDKSCLTSMQFLFRNSRLDIIVSMRSNDIFLGIPYDVFNFTLFQEVMALRLGVEIGTYFHFAGSMHLYENDIERTKKTIIEGVPSEMDMPALKDLEEIKILDRIETDLRIDGHSTVMPTGPFSELAFEVLSEYSFRRRTSCTASQKYVVAD